MPPDRPFAPSLPLHPFLCSGVNVASGAMQLRPPLHYPVRFVQNLMLKGISLLSGPEVETCLLPFLGSVTPFPAISLPPVPQFSSPPNHYFIPLLKIILIGHGVSVQEVLAMGFVQGAVFFRGRDPSLFR